jgi:antibiotic biosynthesis monooxygenase (ABM) superfamily enzyme
LIKQGLEADYEAWLRRTVRIAGERPGHLVWMCSKQNGLALFTCVALPLHRGLQTWLDSPERRTLIAEATPMLADGDQTEVGAVNEFWFAPRPTAPPPPRWKQAVVTLLVILPHTLLVPLSGGRCLNSAFVQLRGRHLPDHPDHRVAGGLPADAGGHRLFALAQPQTKETR